MRYDISLKIEYRYQSAATFGRHLLRLMPLNLPGEQRLVSGLLTTTPEADERLDRIDFFGNPCVEVGHDAPHKTLAFNITARVERLEKADSFPSATPLVSIAQDVRAVRSLDPFAPHHFLPPSPRISPDPARAAYIKALISPQMSALDSVQAIGSALHRDMAFDSKATTVDTPPEEAFQRRSGVCQDFSQIMIGGLRDIGVPAGYVSGFLRTEPPPGKPRLEGADAMHAWVSAWCGAEIGWVEFDPTNNCFVSADHVVVARGRDYSDVAPVKGVLRAFGRPLTSQAVDMIPLD
jgi:transglutaminase-like putative cysteine protease